MKATGWIIRKELLRFLSDRNGAIMTVMLPVFLASLMGMIFAPREGQDNVEVLIADLDEGPRVKALVQAIDDDDTLKVERVSEDEARLRIKSGDSSLALIIPKGADDILQPSGLFSGRQMSAELLFDPSRKTEADMASGILTKIMMEQLTKGITSPDVMKSMFTDLRPIVALGGGPAGGKTEWLSFIDAGISLADSNAAAEAAPPETEAAAGEGSKNTGLKPPLLLEKHELTAAGPAKGYNGYAHNYAGMLCMFLLFMSMQLATSLVNERKDGALDRVRTTLAKPSQILLGTGLAASLIALVTSVLVYAVGMVIFKIEILGSIFAFIVLLISLCLLVGGFSLLLAGVGRTEKQINTFGTFAVLIMSFAGGAMIPSFVMPEWLVMFARVLPTHWATEGLAAATWRGLPMADILLPAAVITVFAVTFAAIGMRTFQWEE